MPPVRKAQVHRTFSPAALDDFSESNDSSFSLPTLTPFHPLSSQDTMSSVASTSYLPVISSRPLSNPSGSSSTSSKRSEEDETRLLDSLLESSFGWGSPEKACWEQVSLLISLCTHPSGPSTYELGSSRMSPFLPQQNADSCTFSFPIDTLDDCS